MAIYFLIFFFIVGSTYCGDHEDMLNYHFKYQNITCEGNQCKFLFDMRNSTFNTWKSVSLGHTDKVDEGLVEVYDYYSGDVILNPRNVFPGSILSLQRRSTRTVGCTSGSCTYEVCVARGRTQIIKEYDENYNPATYIDWEPLVSFNDLIRGNGVGPRLKFSYTIKNGQISKLEVNPKVHFWSECESPQYAYGDDEVIEVPVQYN